MAEESGNPTSSDLGVDPLYARAVSLATKGYYVFPAQVTRHADGTKDVRPWDHWADNSTTDLDTIAWWFRDGHNWTDVCIDCGKSGIVVVDLDVRDGADGRETWRDLITRDGGRYSHTELAGKRIKTPGGGEHLYFRNDPREVIGSRNGAWEHVDVKGAGGMVFAYGYVPKPEALPLRPAWLAERVKVVGGMSGPSRTPQTYGQLPDESRDWSGPDGFSVPSQMRAFTKAQAEAFCAPAWGALTSAPRGTINERLNEAAVVFSHFVPEFWSAADVEGWLIEGQRQAWVAAGGRDDGDYAAATATIRSGLGQSTDPWRAIRAADAPAAFGGRVVEGEPLPPVGSVERAGMLGGLAGEFLDVDGLATLPARDPLIRGVLDKEALATLTGAYGSMKTFVALDMALCVASGSPWHGKAVNRGNGGLKVWYLLAEGVRGLRDRVSAWKDEWQRTRVGPDGELLEQLDLSGFRVLPRSVQVLDQEWALLLELAAIEKPALIVVDTKARFTVGLEENSASETAVAVGRLDALKVAAGGTVLVVHHTGWDDSRMRGSSAWGGALDVDILVRKEGEPTAPKVVVSSAKVKDAEPFADIRLQGRIVELGVDVEGEVVTSVAFLDRELEVAETPEATIAGALDVTMEQHPEVLNDLVAVMESVAPAGSPFGRTQAEIRALMLLGGAVHPAVRRVARRGAHAGKRGYSRADIHQAFVLAAAYGWLQAAETPSKLVVLGAAEREAALEAWRSEHPQEAVGKTDING